MTPDPELEELLDEIAACSPFRPSEVKAAYRAMTDGLYWLPAPHVLRLLELSATHAQACSLPLAEVARNTVAVFASPCPLCDDCGWRWSEDGPFVCACGAVEAGDEW